VLRRRDTLNPDETQQLIVDQTPAARQLRAGFQWLRFERELEREFRREQAAQRLSQIRLNLYLAAALVIAFGGLNTLVLGERMPASIWLVQFGLLLPVVGAAIFVTHMRNGRRIYPRVAPVLVPIAGLAVIAIELQAAKLDVHSLFATVVLSSIFTYYLVGLLFYEAVRANALTWAAYVAFGLASGVGDVHVIYNALVLLCANVVGASVAYGTETVLRAHFLEARLLSEAASRDGLTALYNRRRFDEHLETVWQQAQREGATLALLLVDIDFFKRFNDRHGHQAGDECLRGVAAALQRAARRPLDFVARYGGEEFAVVLYDPSREYVRELATRIHAGVSALQIPHGDSVAAPQVTVSIGTAYVAPTLERSSHGFVQLADEALYEAKGDGRNRTAYRDIEYADLETGSFRAAKRGAA
jgi:diguanylate cyclase (GGDEF)-like protein